MADSAQLPVPRNLGPNQTFVGLAQRAAALLIDIVLIYFAGYTLTLGLRRPLMELGPWLPLLSTAAAFAYFWLGNGPMGGGTTFGKAILNLHVVTADEDQPGIPGYRRSLRRALLQFPLIYLALFQFARTTFDLAPRYGAIGDAFVRTGVIALLLTHGYSMITHPQKATWYDLWSGVRVTPDPTPSDPPGKLKERFVGEVDRRGDAHRMFSRYFFVAVCIVFGMTMAPILRDPYRKANLRLIERVGKTTPLEGYELEGIVYRSGRDYEAWSTSFASRHNPFGTEADSNHGRTREGATADPVAVSASTAAQPSARPEEKAAPEPTTASLSRSALEPGTGMHPGEVVLFMSWVRKRGVASPQDMASLSGQMEALRAAAAEYASDREALGVKPEAPLPTRFVCALSDRFRFVIFSPGEGLSGIVQGPIDPEEGPLTDAWYEPAP